MKRSHCRPARPMAKAGAAARQGQAAAETRPQAGPYARAPRRMRRLQSSASRLSAVSEVTLPSMMGRCKKSSLS